MKNHPELLHDYFASNPVMSQLSIEQELLLTLFKFENSGHQIHHNETEKLQRVIIGVLPTV